MMFAPVRRVLLMGTADRGCFPSDARVIFDAGLSRKERGEGVHFRNA